MNILDPIPEIEIQDIPIILSLTKIIKQAIQEIYPIIELIHQEIKQIKITNQILELEVLTKIQYLKIQENRLIRITFEEEMNLIIKM